MFKNLHELIVQMPDKKTCREWLAKQRWNGNPVCPHCGFEGKIMMPLKK
ncbi:MAG: transposase [Chitinophagaceae bacterium]|nr:transposase [Chitinophagaceae bacterium]